ncbi:uncharacterized protein Z518_08524 [Rhinocladiella mackenziei CBS 650.93]|uniref:Uncharacterized protein n=1 Tax=Rhinocladiella mackenziei CBS 650.93 TaxID=1442369 RepID=A0A0D2GWI8_9EURO|nr:uncharacterized protein Z518_08524 [Rhinocladiella mackenziei CBS 650.93]KIX02583.1 hypothetical protein Z518_08524 [Rhinocladiella mackenziei CBS 650.93]
MRKWKCPYGKKRLCSAIETSISSRRVLEHKMSTFEDEKEMYQCLLGPASSRGFVSSKKYEETLLIAAKVLAMQHRIELQ